MTRATRTVWTAPTSQQVRTYREFPSLAVYMRARVRHVLHVLVVHIQAVCSLSAHLDRHTHTPKNKNGQKHLGLTLQIAGTPTGSHHNLPLRISKGTPSRTSQNDISSAATHGSSPKSSKRFNNGCGSSDSLSPAVARLLSGYPEPRRLGQNAPQQPDSDHGANATRVAEEVAGPARSHSNGNNVCQIAVNNQHKDVAGEVF
jgi:hypothetical protein